MSIRLPEESRQVLTEKVNKGEEEVLQAIQRLAKGLGEYGFRGIIAGKLEVTVMNDLNESIGSVTCSFSFPYCR